MGSVNAYGSEGPPTWTQKKKQAEEAEKKMQQQPKQGRVLKIATWNCFGISAKLKELEDHLHTWDVDICCLQELCIQADQAEFLEGLFRSWGYKLWLTLAPGAERANHRGSLAMLTRIKSEQIDLQLRQENEGRAQMVQVERGTTCTVIVNVHFPHDKAAREKLLAEITARTADQGPKSELPGPKK